MIPLLHCISQFYYSKLFTTTPFHVSSIESTMTDNMRGISEKYETLEETFGKNGLFVVYILLCTTI